MQWWHSPIEYNLLCHFQCFVCRMIYSKHLLFFLVDIPFVCFFTMCRNEWRSYSETFQRKQLDKKQPLRLVNDRVTNSTVVYYCYIMCVCVWFICYQMCVYINVHQMICKLLFRMHCSFGLRCRALIIFPIFWFMLFYYYLHIYHRTFPYL